MYAIYQSGYAVYGVGRTPLGALREANKWLDAPVRLADLDTPSENGEVDGRFVLRRCSQALYNEVRNSGGDVHYTIEHGELLLAEECE
mgnify:CR=1 FL=1